ncbi:MAG: MFS transporter [Pseudorhodoplanes sp.]|jgi:MFS family permease|nr:MFS transporter [Pseudorhodoplanes sp.]
MRTAGPSSRTVVAALGLVQILAWGSSFYFPAVFAAPIAAETGWPLAWVVGGVSIGLLVGGLISPLVGRLIARHGGRPLLGASSLLFAIGLVGIGLASSLAVYLAAWCVVGLGMGTGLYDAVFAALGRRYGQGARAAIATLTLFGGFASTVCWPLSALLLEQIGWRGACLIYAGLHLLLGLPLQLLVLRGDGQPAAADAAPTHDKGSSNPPARRGVTVLLGLILSLAAGIGSIVVVHLLTFLQAGGIGMAAAVSLGMLFGPAQVGARMVERLFGQHYHPVWTLLAAALLMLIGLVLLLAAPAFAALAIILYAGGYGISWIARGTVPLAIFGAARYPLVISRLALPSLVVQALAPSAGALLITAFGAAPTIAILATLAALNLALAAALMGTSRPPAEEY